MGTNHTTSSIGRRYFRLIEWANSVDHPGAEKYQVSMEIQPAFSLTSIPDTLQGTPDEKHGHTDRSCSDD